MKIGKKKFGHFKSVLKYLNVVDRNKTFKNTKREDSLCFYDIVWNILISDRVIRSSTMQISFLLLSFHDNNN